MGKLASYDTRSGDIHYWGVWHGLHPFTDFRNYKGRFMSEYGFQSFPEFNSVRKYTLPEDHNIESDVMMAHQRSGIGNLRIRQYMAEDYRVPQDFEQFLYVGQLLQAEAIKLAIESHRADMPYCMGSLYWQLNDCWPVASWSGIDYYGRWKALHYYVKEAFKPTVLVVSEEDDLVLVKVVSDYEETGKLKLEIRLVDFQGMELNEISKGSSSTVLSKKEFLGNADPASVVFVSELISDNEIIDTDLHYFVKPKDLKLIDPQLNTNIVEKEEIIELNISAKYLAKNVFIHADDLEEQFSDNYFDILPGDTVTVTLSKNDQSQEISKSIQIKHLYLTTIPVK
jgi:beta-mannosidase